MPNGGVPIHMVLYPQDGSGFVCYCHGGDLRVYARNAWDESKALAEPVLRLTEAEGAALAWFLRYWLGEHRLRPGYEMRREVNAEFDF